MSNPSEIFLDEAKKSEIFRNDAKNRFEKYKLKAENYIKILPTDIQLDTLKTWIQQIDSLFGSDIDKFIKDEYSYGKCFNLSPFLEINFTGFDFVYFMEAKKLGFNFNAITKPDFQECIKDDNSFTQNLRYQTIIVLLTSLKEYFIKKLKLIENNSSKNKNEIKSMGFHSTLSDGKTQDLFNQLKGIYIDKNTNYDYFKAIFKYEPLPEHCIIEWLKSNVLLAYFIKKVFHSENPFNVWVKAESIFTRNKKPIKNLRQSENNPHPRGYKELETIL